MWAIRTFHLDMFYCWLKRFLDLEAVLSSIVCTGYHQRGIFNILTNHTQIISNKYKQDKHKRTLLLMTCLFMERRKSWLKAYHFRAMNKSKENLLNIKKRYNVFIALYDDYRFAFPLASLLWKLSEPRLKKYPQIFLKRIAKHLTTNDVYNNQLRRGRGSLNWNNKQ